MKKMFNVLLVATLMFSMVTSVSAKNIYKGYSSGSYNKFVCAPISGIYRYWVYKYSKSGSIINCNRLISNAISHTKGKDTKTLKSSKSYAYSYSTTITWNEKIGAEFGISGTISGSAEAGYGVTTGWKITATQCESVSLKIGKNAPTGVYGLAAGRPFYKMRMKKYNWITDNLKTTGYFYMPIQNTNTVIYTVKSTNNQQSWEIYD